RAASGYVPVVLTARVGSPPPTSTTAPGFGPATALVWSWYAGPRVASTVTAVASFIVEAGMAPSPWFWVYSDWPLSTSVTCTATWLPRRWSASGPRRAVATASAAGIGASVGAAPSTGDGAGAGLALALGLDAASGPKIAAGRRTKTTPATSARTRTPAPRPNQRRSPRPRR